VNEQGSIILHSSHGDSTPANDQASTSNIARQCSSSTPITESSSIMLHQSSSNPLSVVIDSNESSSTHAPPTPMSSHSTHVTRQTSQDPHTTRSHNHPSSTHRPSKSATSPQIQAAINELARKIVTDKDQSSSGSRPSKRKSNPDTSNPTTSSIIIPSPIRFDLTSSPFYAPSPRTPNTMHFSQIPAPLTTNQLAMLNRDFANPFPSFRSPSAMPRQNPTNMSQVTPQQNPISMSPQYSNPSQQKTPLYVVRAF
jgi:hypothetical protein